MRSVEEKMCNFYSSVSGYAYDSYYAKVIVTDTDVPFSVCTLLTLCYVYFIII